MSMIQKIVLFVQSHGHPCRIEGNHLKIAILGTVIQSKKSANIGKSFWEIVRVPADWDSVFEELGY